MDLRDLDFRVYDEDSDNLFYLYEDKLKVIFDIDLQIFFEDYPLPQNVKIEFYTGYKDKHNRKLYSNDLFKVDDKLYLAEVLFPFYVEFYRVININAKPKFERLKNPAIKDFVIVGNLHLGVKK